MSGDKKKTLFRRNINQKAHAGIFGRIMAICDYKRIYIIELGNDRINSTKTA